MNVLKFYSRLYVGFLTQTPPTPPAPNQQTNVYEFSQLCGAIFSLSCEVLLSPKLGKFTNFKTLISAVLKDFVNRFGSKFTFTRGRV